MTWLRIDDKFPRHPKIAALTDRQFRIWMRLLCYCSEYETEGRVDSVAIKTVQGLTPKLIRLYIRFGLVDEENGSKFAVHDWETYNPKDRTGAERQARWRERRNAGVTKARNAKRNAPVPSLTASTHSYVRDGTLRSEETDAAAHTATNVPAPLNAPSREPKWCAQCQLGFYSTHDLDDHMQAEHGRVPA